MNKLNKNILRYVMKNKFSLGGLFVLFSICMSSLLTLGMLSNNFSGNYNSVVKNGNQHNIVINELYSSSSIGDENKKELLNILQSQEYKNKNINARRFEGLTIQTDSASQSKIIKYEPKYPSQYNENNQWYIPTVNDNTIPTDNLQVYIQTGLPYLEANYLNKVQKFYHLPSSIDFEAIVNYVTNTYSIELTGTLGNLTSEQMQILQARQAIVYFLAKGENPIDNYKTLLTTITNLYSTENVNNINVSSIDPKTNSNTQGFFSDLFNKSDSDYNAPIISGSTINFQPNHGLVDIVTKFEDYNSRICIVPQSLLRHQNKEVFSYEEFKNFVNGSKNTSQTSIYNENTIGLPEFDEYFNKISQKYKVKISNLDYLIVGSGITPDFFYPIISLENTVVDFAHESTIYTNNNGYYRTHMSFQTAPLESLILIKYSGSQKLNTIINELNILAEKYLAFPAGTQNTYASNDVNNTYSPTAARVQFIEQLVAIINALTVITSFILTLITLFIVVIILNKFISENKKSLYILIAQGISKYKASLSIILLPLIPCLLAAIFSYLFAFFMQSNVFSIFIAYWPLEIFTSGFNIGIMIGIFVIFYSLSSLVSYLISLRSLRGTVSSGLNTSPAKLGPLAIAAKKPFFKANVLTKFRVSLAFGSFTKLLFLVLSTFLFTTTLSFIGSTITTFNNSLTTVLNTNTSTMHINFATPTRNGGQYYGAGFDEIGQTFTPPNSDVVLNPPSFANSTSGYGSLYNANPATEVPLFKKWANMMYISANDGNRQKQELRYLFNNTTWQFTMDLFVTRKSLVTSDSNPWTDIGGALLPSNQRNASTKYLDELLQKLLSDNRIIKTSSDFIPKNSFTDDYKYTNLSNFYIVNNENSNNFIIEDETPIIKLETNVDLSKLSEDNADHKNEINNFLMKYGDVFGNNFSILSAKYIKDNNAIRIELANPISVLTSRKIFQKLFYFKPDEPNYPANIFVYDEIMNKNELFSNYNWDNVLFSIPRLTNSFINYSIYVLTRPEFQSYLYKICYNQAIINNEDEPYTYVDASFINPRTGELFDKFDSGYNYQTNVDIKGIQKDSKYINLVNEKNEDINDKLFNNSVTDQNAYPLIPNLYAKKLYNLNIGDKLIVFAENNVDRYNPKLNKNDSPYYNEYVAAYTKTYEIVDFTNSTKDIEFYTNMSSAQKSIGLAYIDDATKTQVLPNNINTDIINLIYPEFTNEPRLPLINLHNTYGGFNGVFSGDDLKGVSNALQLYSPSGLYLGSTEISTDLEAVTTLMKYNLIKPRNYDTNANSKLETNKKWQILANALYLTESETQEFIKYNESLGTPTILGKYTEAQSKYADQIIELLNNIYMKTVYLSMIETPGSVRASVSTFQNLTDLINNIEVVLVALISFLSLIVIIVTAWMIIKDLTQLVVLLKVLGLSDWNNSLNMFAIFVPTWLISGILTIPFLYLSLEIFKEVVFVSMGLIITPTISWLAFFVIFMFVAGFLTLILWLANRYIRKINLIESLKW